MNSKEFSPRMTAANAGPVLRPEIWAGLR